MLRVELFEEDRVLVLYSLNLCLIYLCIGEILLCVVLIGSGFGVLTSIEDTLLSLYLCVYGRFLAGFKVCPFFVLVEL